jgi:cob(I)alamin adenosyltransferase
VLQTIRCSTVHPEQPDQAEALPLDAASPLDQAAAELGMGGNLAPEATADAYRRRMERRKEVQQQRVGERNLEKGLVLVFTGDGKGKTTAALGLVLRTLGHGEQVAVVQFIKGGWQPRVRSTSPRAAAHRLGCSSAPIWSLR